jgi:hypothetical protein
LLVDLNKVYEVFHRISLFSMDPVKNIAVMGNSCFWLEEIKYNFFSETTNSSVL